LPGTPDPARVALAFDFGLKRIGVAVGDTLTCSAVARGAIAVAGGQPDWHTIDRIIAANGPHVLVVGTPYNVDGDANEMTALARQFAADLAARHALPVEQVDERYSSLEATEKLKAQRASGERRRRLRKDDIDGAAAVVILQRWLEGER
jgi:putative Holliday junction resolvase